MASASTQEIQDVVLKFLDGGPSLPLFNLACKSDDTKKALLDSAGVVDKLVDLVLRDKPIGDSCHYALYVLCHLVKLGQVAQDAIARAHDGAIFAWLAGPQDHGHVSSKNSLITTFTNNHPLNTFRLDAARGGVTSLVELVIKSLQCDDVATVALSIKVLVGITQETGMKLEESLPVLGFTVCSQILEGESIDVLVQLGQSKTLAHTAVALDLLRGVLCDLLQHNMQRDTMQEVPLAEIISTVMFDGENNDDISGLQDVADSDDAIAFLLNILNIKAPSSLENVTVFAEKLGGLIPLLVRRMNKERSKQPSSQANVLALLKHLSRVQPNQALFQQHDGIKCLTKLLDVSVEGEKASVARIIANVSCRNRHMSELLLDCDVAKELVAMIKSPVVKLTLMALRNLTSNDITRARIGRPHVITRLIEIIRTGKTIKQREAAVAVLGNLARLPATHKNIHYSGGPGAVLAFVPQTTTSQQLETAAGALWVLGGVAGLREKGGVAIFQTAISLHQSHQVPWATRLLQRLTHDS